MNRTRKISRLLLVGDSLIEYGGWQGYLPGREIVNLGRSGEAVEELRERAAHIVHRQATPDLVLVMSGTNNVALGRPEFIAAYAEILAIFQETWPVAIMLINSLLPMELYQQAPETVVRINERLRHLTEQKQAHYLDVWRVLADQNNQPLPGVLEDEVHLTARGYHLWAACLEEFLLHREQP